MKEPVLILSDLHLGHKASSIDDVSALEPLLRGAGTLLLNGDTWQELAREFRDDGQRLWKDLQSLCRRMEIDIIALPGNHDPGNRDADYIALADGKIIIMHGDTVFPEVAPWSRMAMQKNEELQRLIAAHPRDTSADRFALAREVSRMLVPPYYAHSKNIFARIWDAITPPGRAWRMIVAWATMVRETRSFAAKYFPDCAIMICGHFHRSGIWDKQLPVIINSGSFMPPGSAYWSEWSENFLRVGIIQKKNGHWQRGALLAAWKLDA
jgi:UDP-2,3-diacylglucosamine pyrophosphatase LpxH